MEVINYLLGYKNIKIIQDTQMFCFSLDSVLLPNFVTLNKKTKKILDIGCGNAPISLILSTKTDAKINGVEIQKDVYELAKRNVLINNKTDQIEIINDDIKKIYKNIDSDCYDTIVCNPPFFKLTDNSKINNSKFKTIARHEVSLTIDDIMIISKKLLKNNGNISIIHRPERMINIIMIMQKHNIEPKKIQFVYPKKNKNANMILIEGTKNGKSGLKVLEPLFIHNTEGKYTEQVMKFFE